MDDNDVYPILV